MGEPVLGLDREAIARGMRRNAQSSALYAAVIAREYPRLLEHCESDEAMREAIGKAESVVRVWWEVVNGE